VSEQRVRLPLSLGRFDTLVRSTELCVLTLDKVSDRRREQSPHRIGVRAKRCAISTPDFSEDGVFIVARQCAFDVHPPTVH
jgi:hypothetical protein